MAIDESSARYYKPDGSPAYEAGIREARDHGYGISVTSVTKQWTNPGLERYKQRSVLEAALTLPRLPGEDDAEFIERVMEDAGEHASRAADLGILVHAAMEAYITDGKLRDDHLPPDVRESVIAACNWVDEMSLIGAVEEPFYHPYGYGGKRDFHGFSRKEGGEQAPLLVDWKTQFIHSQNKNGSLKATFYETWAWQLAAYRAGTDVPADRCFSVIISTNPEIPGIKVKQWPATHKAHTNISQGERVFMNLLKTWQIMHHFPVLQEEHDDARASAA